nr:AraC family transcriptional regulator [Marinicella sp. W31]MDC2877016.1 helix-turn-helix domain-containing protein [Marinicella sp. W31]
MTEIAIIRAAHLLVYIDELREIGVPVERALARSRLPPWALEDPDAYVSYALCLEWLAGCSSDMELMEFGFRAARRGSLATLSGPFRRAILGAPTGFERLQTFVRCAALEDNVLSIRLQPEGDRIRVISTQAGFETNPLISIGEWVDLQGMISIVRSVAGPRWCPHEMTFVSRQRPDAVILEAFPNTRILVGQPCTSILVSSSLLAVPYPPGSGAPARRTESPTDAVPEDDPTGWSFAAALRVAVRPYLADGYPALPEIAEAFQMSGRTLQRRLSESGRSYLDVVQEARFDLARELLGDPSTRITEVALATGYGNQQHFARAFRRYAGVSPSVFRKALSENA